MKQIFRVVVLCAVVLLLSPAYSQAETPVRIFVAQNATQAFNADGGGGAFTATGGTNNQTVEIQKNIQEKRECSEFRVTNRAKRAHFVITMDRSEGGFSKRTLGVFSRDNKIAVFDGYGDMIFAKSVRAVGNAVKDACKAIRKEVASGAELITVGAAAEE